MSLVNPLDVGTFETAEVSGFHQYGIRPTAGESPPALFRLAVRCREVGP